jgi:hypothetical protein
MDKTFKAQSVNQVQNKSRAALIVISPFAGCLIWLIARNYFPPVREEELLERFFVPSVASMSIIGLVLSPLRGYSKLFVKSPEKNPIVARAFMGFLFGFSTGIFFGAFGFFLNGWLDHSPALTMIVPLKYVNTMTINHKLGFYAFVTLPNGNETSFPLDESHYAQLLHENNYPKYEGRLSVRDGLLGLKWIQSASIEPK